MATAIIGTGNIGGALARDLVRGGEPVVLAAKDQANAAALAQELGDLARAASVEDAIAGADAVVFAVWLDTIKDCSRRMRACSTTRSSSTPRTRSVSTRTGR
jgi:8-hydroxy-5-deazaflavin:NADPH oxidoreductase